jgi:hypothetical protein
VKAPKSSRDHNSLFVTRGEKRLARQITQAIVATAIYDGKLDPSGKTPEEFGTDVERYLQRVVTSKSQIAWNVDFRSKLIRQARKLRKAKRVEEAVLYYAIWIEHMLNSMIAGILRRRQTSDGWIRDFIKETGLRSKYAFVIITLCERSPSRRQANAIREIADRRNQFVHYKWLYYEESEDKKLEKSYERALTLAENVARHLREIEKRYFRTDLKPIPDID